jgi:hypothetical protein
MKIGLHGGDCCGIKTIYSLGCYPSSKVAAKPAPTTDKTSYGQHWATGVSDMRSRNKHGDCDFFNEAAPAETYRKRFERLVNFIKSKRSHGIIEVVINVNQSAWKATLKRLGFKLSAEAINSNSMVIIYVYHLVY